MDKNEKLKFQQELEEATKKIAAQRQEWYAYVYTIK